MNDPFYNSLKYSKFTRVIWCLFAIILALLITIETVESIENLSLTSLIITEIIVIYFGSFKSNGLQKYFDNITSITTLDLDKHTSLINIWWEIFLQSLFYLMAIFVAFNAIPKEIAEKTEQKVINITKNIAYEHSSLNSLYPSSFENYKNWKYDKEANVICLSLEEKQKFNKSNRHIVLFSKSVYMLTEFQENSLKSWVQDFPAEQEFRIFGFASDEYFYGTSPDISKNRNDTLAIRRAKAVESVIERYIPEKYIELNSSMDKRDSILQTKFKLVSAEDTNFLHRSVLIEIID